MMILYENAKTALSELAPFKIWQYKWAKDSATEHISVQKASYKPLVTRQQACIRSISLQLTTSVSVSLSCRLILVARFLLNYLSAGFFNKALGHRQLYLAPTNITALPMLVPARSHVQLQSRLAEAAH
jgi:hypothetical protein